MTIIITSECKQSNDSVSKNSKIDNDNRLTFGNRSGRTFFVECYQFLMNRFLFGVLR